MDTVYMMLLLLMCFSSVCPLPELLQAETASAVPGGSVTLSCSVKNRDIGDRWLRWFRQTPGKTPVWILTHKSTNDGGALLRGSGFTDRFAHSRDDAKKSFSLTVNQVELKDSAVYYCSLFDSGYYFGKGTELHVVDRQLQVPSLELFPPSRQEVTSAETVTLSCLIRGFYPAFVDILWKVRGIETQSGVSTNLPNLEADNSYSISSYLRVPVSSWNSKDHYSCLFRYKSQDTLVQKSISLDTCNR